MNGFEIKTLKDIKKAITGYNFILSRCKNDMNFIKHVGNEFIALDVDIDYNIIFNSGENVKVMNVIDNYNQLFNVIKSTLSLKLEWYDLAIFDLLHVLENSNPSHNSFYTKISYNIKTLRKERRLLKNYDIEPQREQLNNLRIVLKNYQPKQSPKKKLKKYYIKTNIMDHINVDDDDINSSSVKKCKSFRDRGLSSNISSYMKKYSD